MHVTSRARTIHDHSAGREALIGITGRKACVGGLLSQM